MGKITKPFFLNAGGIIPSAGALKTYVNQNSQHLNNQDDLPIEYAKFRSKPPPVNPEVGKPRQPQSFIKVIQPEQEPPNYETAILNFAADDSGNADRFESSYGNIVRYNADIGKWMIFNGKYWHLDNLRIIKKLAESVAVKYREAATSLASSNKESDRQLFYHSRQSCNNNRLNAMLDILKHRVGIQQEDFDQASEKIVVANGVIDLRTGLLDKYDSDLLLTQYVDVPYHPDAYEDSLFSQFVSSICGGDFKLESYLQRAFGYGITGETREQVLFLEHGDGSNGKTTLNEAVANVMHDYVFHIPIQTLLNANDSKSGSRATPELAQAVNARVLFASESEEHEYLNESAVKQLTGESVISVRHLYQEPFEFRPRFKIFLDTNHLPRIKGKDFAIWRRIKVIPFGVTFTGTKKDSTLPSRLQQPREREAILAWLVKGAMLYYRDGLEDVPSVKEATKNYVEKEDTIRPFLNSCVSRVDQAICPASELYHAYVAFCFETNKAPENQTAFGRTLSSNGFQKKRNASGSIYLGVHLKLADV